MPRHKYLSVLGVAILNRLRRKPTYGADLIQQIKPPTSGNVYTLLRQFETEGYVISQTELIEAKDLGRPQRTEYSITLAGLEILKETKNYMGVK